MQGILRKDIKASIYGKGHWDEAISIKTSKQRHIWTRTLGQGH